MTKRPMHELTPLVEDPAQTSYVRELLQAGRDADVAGYDVDKGLAKHMALVEAGAPMPHWAQGLRPAAGKGAAAAAGSSIAGWIAVPLAVAALTSAVVLVSRQSPAPVAQNTPAHTAGQAPSAQPEAGGGPLVAAEPSVATAAPAPHVARAAEPSQPPSAHATPRNAHAKRTAAAASEPRPVLAEDSTKAAAKPSSSGELFDTAQPAAAPAQPRADAQKTQTVVEQAPEAGAKPEPPQPAAAKTATKASPQDDARLEREMAMLAVAQRVLQTDPARSLALARQGESEFAGSMFTQERQQVLLLALVKLGRMDEARQLAKPYLARYPHGPFSDRVRRALATGKVER